MSELQSTVVSKVENNCTYPMTANYWAPLEYNEEDDDVGVQTTTEYAVANNVTDAAVQHDLRHMILSWINQRVSKNKPFVRTASTMIVDSGATSHFVRPEEKLPITGTSHKVVMLPDGTSLQATHTALLPFESLSGKARNADVLPGLRPNSLISVGKLADADYTTIFHPRGDGEQCMKRTRSDYSHCENLFSKGGEMRMGCGDSHMKHSRRTRSIKRELILTRMKGRQLYTTYHLQLKWFDTSMLPRASQSKTHG